jgi:hypothetical protein
MAEQMKAIIIANPALTSEGTRDPDTNTYCLTSQHIISAAFLVGLLGGDMHVWVVLYRTTRIKTLVWNEVTGITENRANRA